jgi:hypothetical protein
LEVQITGGHTITAVRCHYRHVNQAERFLTLEMQANEHVYRGTIPAPYTNSAYPLQYYFTLKEGATTHLYPGLGADRMSLPYFVLRRATS